MKKNYRIIGMMACLVLALSALVLVAFGDRPQQELAMIIVMFVGGYGLRETVDHFGENENDKKQV